MIHIVVVGILVIIMAILTYVGANSVGLMPVQASAQAVPIDWMWGWQVVAISFLFALIVVPIFYSLIVFRRKKGDTSDAEHIEGNTPLEITWTVIPLIIVVAFAYMGAYSLGESRRITDPNAMIIKVTARQFSWTFEYPEYGFVSNELHLPVWKQVVLKMEAVDVIHSFWVPEFRVKQDVVPGRVTEYRITPNLVGSYKVRCAELCGSNHADMEGAVIISTQADYDTWVAEQVELAAAATPEGRGKKLITANGCIGCHSVTPQPGVSAPSWFGLFGSQVLLADGSTVTADDAYITESILDPAAKEVEGYSPTIMKPFTLTPDEIADILAYIKSLK
ncbi:MAG: cytochrome c oxidase subunit II [Chloroflexi bacterium]|nr:cytochrome c oxidase subunit II [Chloroflexota bacterium]